MKLENNLGADPIRSLVWRIAIPSMLAQFVSVLYSIVDRIYISNIPLIGETALAGVGVCGPVVTMLGAFASLIGVGGAPLMSIRLGAGKAEEAQRILANGFLMLCICAGILTVAVFPMRHMMLMAFGASEVTYPYANAYFTVYLFGTVFNLLALGMNQFIICQGFSKVGMKSVVLGAVLNIILDPVFIFWMDMGVVGAALATVLSQMASCGYVLRFLFGPKVPVRITFGRYHWRLMGRILAIGFTPFAIIAVDNVMIISMNSILQRYGGAALGDQLVTCATIAQSFMLIVTMPLGGISAGTQTILAFNYGARRRDRVLEAEKHILLMCVGYVALLFVLARLAGPLFVRLFTAEPDLAAEAFSAIKVCTLAIIPLGAQYVVVDGLTGMGQVQFALPLSFFRKGVYFAALMALPLFFGARAAFYAEPVSDVLGPLVSLLVYRLAMKKVLNFEELPLHERLPA
ncbi:putative efflux protein, MATE family [Oscillibacter sp. PC13]|uniref:MATE family efflux transporter n=1 Tax=Oscillibacter sp. PC13 TaxID=1855299 RepID=UPI0008EB8040|nr:MATE family efflux transporter [Oscillibacter sp. PC13]SFP29613.1 putative efflux protein, MATE family [Oscillibacter sp. PC13]